MPKLVPIRVPANLTATTPSTISTKWKLDLRDIVDSRHDICKALFTKCLR
jgi:hypothetical protein